MSQTASIAISERRDDNYRRSLLKIRVPVVVTLAATKKSVSQILEIAPGTIIQFDKLCSDELSLDVSNRTLARGEPVRVGQRLGLRITGMTPPDKKSRSVTTPRN